MTTNLFDKAGGPPDRELDLAESVAGEEDPGASLDLGLAGAPGRTGPPAGPRGGGTSAPTAPGDEAPAGTPGTGEDVCPRCGGSGQLDGRRCTGCLGTGKVTAGIGGG